MALYNSPYRFDTALSLDHRLRRTNLGSVTANSRVNLERSLPADGRNSGHFVQGHVDEAGTILVRVSPLPLLSLAMSK